MRHGGQARPRADRRPRLRLAHRQACQVERHRRGQGGPHAGRGRRPDEPHRLGRDRPQAGPRRGRDGGPRAGFRRLLPLRRLRDAGRRVRRRGDRPAGRLGARRGFDQKGERGRHRHVFRRRASLQTLKTISDDE